MPKPEHMARWYRPDGTIEQHGTARAKADAMGHA